MSGPNSLEDLKELLLPIYNFFDGIVWVLHDSVNSKEEEFLKTIIKNGKIIHYYYTGNHDISRNHYLWLGPQNNGDYILTCDLLERPSINFIKNIPNLINQLNNNNIDCLYYYGKPYLFKFNHFLKYQGSPHEGLFGFKKGIEFSTFEPNENNVRLNIRPIKRVDPFHWVSHYAKYMLFINSNHYLLGWENKTPEELNNRNKLRVDFINLMFNRGYKNNVEHLKLLLSDTIDEELKYYLNNEKVWSDFYQFFILNNKNIIHSHNIEDIIKI